MPEINEIKKQLSEKLSEGMLSHAVLFEGEKGMGKEKLAIWLSKAILCKSSEPPCGKCSICKKTDAGNHPDVEIIRGKDSARGFSVDRVREIKETLWLSPNESEQKIYILPDIQNMSVEAENALLKSLEEPPEHARFIMTCDNAEKLLDTIISRCTVYKVEAPKGEECSSYLMKNNPGLSENDAMLLTFAYGGNIGRAEQAIEDGKLEMVRLIAKSPEKLRKGMSYELLSGMNGYMDRNSLTEFLDAFGNIVGKCGVLTASGKPSPVRITPSQAIKTNEITSYGKESISQNCSPELVASWVCMKLSGVFGGNL